MENVEKIENELNDVFSKKVKEKVEKLTVIEKEENQKIEKQMQKLNLEKEELTYRRENFEREKLNFEQNLAFSTFQRCSDSLGKKKSSCLEWELSNLEGSKKICANICLLSIKRI